MWLYIEITSHNTHVSLQRVLFSLHLGIKSHYVAYVLRGLPMLGLSGHTMCVKYVYNVDLTKICVTEVDP